MTTYSPEDREKALAIYESDGAAEAARQTGIPRATISQWAHRAGVTRDVPENARIMLAAAQLSMEERRLRLAERLLTEAEIEAGRLREPFVERRLSSSGKEVEWSIPEPLPGDRRNIALTLAILVDKSQLLSGEATQRTEQMTPEQARQKIEAIAERIELRVLKSA